jgi:peptide/nickel transport system substrate-binding protein
MNKKIMTLLASAAAVVSGLAGIPAAHAASTTLTYGVIGDLSSWEASAAQAGNLAPFYQAVYDSVLEPTSAGGVAPGIATTWHYDSTKTILTLNIRLGLKFSNGDKLDPAAVAANLNAFPKGSSPDAGNASSISSVTTSGTHVVIKLKAPDPAFLNYLARDIAYIQDPSQIGTKAAKTNPIGSGPYVLVPSKSTPGSLYTFAKNPKYWNQSAIKFPNLIIKVVADNTAAVNALRTHAVDILNIADKSSVPSLKGSGIAFAEQQLDWSGLSLVDLSGKMGTPLKDVRVRQAINYAFDRNLMLKVVGNGFGVVTHQVFPTYSAGYDPALENSYPYDLAKAKSLMAQAGYANGFTLQMPELTAYTGNAPPQAMADALAAINIKVVYTDLAFPDFFPQLLQPKYPAFWMQLERSANDWQFLNFLISPNAAWNPSHYSDATSSKLISQIQTASAAKAPGLLKQLNDYISQQAWYVPFYAVQAEVGYNPQTVKIVNQPGNAVPYLLQDVSPAA